jgi:dTDP-4-amino-4,6-dideoxygalactose transaminase
VRLAESPAWSDPALHLLTVLIDFAAAGTTRQAVVEALKAKGVGSQVHYIPVHRQPYYLARYGAAAPARRRRLVRALPDPAAVSGRWPTATSTGWSRALAAALT